MADEIVRLPYNPQGNLAAAFVAEESITVRSSTGDGYNFYVPKYAPYFRNGFKLYNPDTNAYLVEGVDYIHTHAFNAMAQLVGLEIYGSIMFIDRSFSGNLQCSYYSLGGEFTLNAQQILEVLANNLMNPRETYWERVAETPQVYPPINHQHNIETDTMTWDDVVKAIEGLKDPLAQGLNLAMQAVKTHERRQDNPHNVNKTQIGLGLVENYRLAREEDLEGAGENLYMTLAMTRLMIANLGGDSAAAHIANRNNPHQVNKTQVGLALVENFQVASTSEMINGVLTDRYTTPAGVMAAIRSVTNGIDARLSQVEGDSTAHYTNINNPHNVTKNQVGLGFVQNFPIATINEAKAGSATDKYMTPALVRSAIEAIAIDSVAGHMADFNNPHQVTKEQVGLSQVLNYAVATRNEAIEGIVSNKYMTPELTKYAIETLAGEGFGQHLTDYTNPHKTNKDQIGLGNVQNFNIAADSEAVDVNNNGVYMTPYSTNLAIVALAAAKNHTHTPESIGALALAGGTMAGDITIRRIVGGSSSRLMIDGTSGNVQASYLEVSGDANFEGVVETTKTIGTIDPVDNTMNFMDTNGDITGAVWQNVNSVPPVEDPDDPWPEDDEGNKIPPKTVGKLTDYLKSTFIDLIVSDPRFASAVKAILADVDVVVKATDFELK